MKESHHQIISIKGLAEKLRRELNISLKSLSDKITHISKLEKSSWRLLDEVDVSTRSKIQEVDRAAEEQVSNFYNFFLFSNFIIYIDKCYNWTLSNKYRHFGALYVNSEDVWSLMPCIIAGTPKFVAFTQSARNTPGYNDTIHDML